MKHLKGFVLAAVAAMALTAFIGVGSASATVLCKTNLTSGCAAAGWDYATGTTSHWTQKSGTSLIFRVPGSTILETCTTSTAHSTTTTTGSGSETVTSHFDTWNFGAAGTACSKTADILTPGSHEIHSISGTDNGTVTASGFELTISTIFGSCVYGSGSSTDLGTLVGGNPASVIVNATIPKISGNGLCPATSAWEAEYEITSPQPLFVAAS